MLCVDDHQDFANLWSSIVDAESDMSSAGVLHSAHDLESEVARRRPDVVLLDLTMPGRDPLEAGALLTGANPEVLLLAFSGYDDTSARAMAKAAGAQQLIPKSLEVEQVLARIRQAWQKHAARLETRP